MHDRSQSGATVFIEPDVVVDAANRLSDARAAEHREIQVVLTNLGKGLGRLRDEILPALDALANLDLDMARARCIVEDGYRSVQVEEGAPLRLVEARHPSRNREIASGPNRQVGAIDPDLVPIQVLGAEGLCYSEMKVESYRSDRG